MDGIPLLGAPGPAPAAGGVVDVTEATFGVEVVERSHQVPVVVDLWAEWCAPCRQLGPVLERLAAEAMGAWVLAKVDVDTNPRLAQALQVQGIPAVKAVVGGQLAAEFTGALPEQQVRAWLGELMALVSGPEGAAAADAEPPAEPKPEPEPAPEPYLDRAEVRRLLDAVRTSAGEDRETARQQLVDLLAQWPADHPEALAARRELANALF